DLAEAVDALLALLGRLVLVSRHRHARHAEEKARIDPVVAGLDAGAGEHAARRPFARGFRAIAGLEDIDDARDHLDRFGFDTARAGDRAHLDALAAAGAGIGHRGGPFGQGGFEGHRHTRESIVSWPSMKPRPDKAGMFAKRRKVGSSPRKHRS